MVLQRAYPVIVPRPQCDLC